MTYATANPNAKNEYIIPVTWQVTDTVKVQANSLKEAYDYIKQDPDDIPLGTEPEYVDGSYEVSYENLDDCLFYQDHDEIVCVDFKCDDNLSQYIDSMLFDSDTNIAVGIFDFKGKRKEISLDIRGEVKVRYKNDIYCHPSEFPDELKERIKKDPNGWDVYAPSGEGNDDTTDVDIYVDCDNWFEYLYDTDGEVCEKDVSKMTPEDILSDMMSIVRYLYSEEAE